MRHAPVRARWLATIALGALLGAAAPVHAGERVAASGSRFFTNPPPSSKFFTDPAPPSSFFTDPPHPAWFREPLAPSSFFDGASRSRFFSEPVPSFGFARTPRHGPTSYDGLIREIARHHGVDYALVKAMIEAESDFDRRAVSPKGASGLMQLMPATAALHGVRDVFAPRDNIDGGCRYLRSLLDRYGGRVPLAVAAYNAGPERVDAARGVPAIAETQEYLSRVLHYRLAYERER